ncbi:MAG: hypothetical protein ACRC8B_22665 [Aeromonas sobria]|uniref:hypothetical protein n=1 Tax=Aeromonas sobria TaxID=646 RepID=UPI003F38A1C7
MNELLDVADALLTEETLGLVVAVATGGITWPVALGGVVVTGVAALFLPKEKTKQVISTVTRIVTFKRKG